MSDVTVQILTSVTKTFAVMGVGFGFRRLWNRDITVVNELAMLLFVPCLSFSAILARSVAPLDMARVAGAAVLVLGLTAIPGVICVRWLGRSLLLPVLFMNSVNLPFPILEANYGAEGLGHGVLFYMVVQTMVFSVGVLLIAERPNLGVLLRNPALIATLVAIIMQLTDVRPPFVVLETTRLIGSAAIPLILFGFGYALADARLHDMPRAALAAILRMGGGFLAGLAAAHILGLDGTLRDVVILVAAMPSAVITVILARNHDADVESIASVVFLTTMISTVTIPLLLFWLRAS